ncbi:MAG: hypothetical protein LF885_01005 [Rickettsia endosymbiont of Culicoides impunctatus]|nr:MAG: hypothetical protein LF885_01005 [Rickettsia endosymbiont of Culicoides impunctatus]
MLQFKTQYNYYVVNTQNYKGVIMLKDLRLSLERQLPAISKNLNFSYPTSSFYHTTMFWCLSH